MAELEQDLSSLASEEGTTSHGYRLRFLILVVVVALSVGYMVYAAFPGNTRYFLTVTEFMDKENVQDGRMVRVAGKLVDGSFLREEKSALSNFNLIDKDGDGGTAHLAASYVGVVPDLFFNPHSEIILEGSLGLDRVFQADNILVKCPSKYQSLEQESRQIN